MDRISANEKSLQSVKVTTATIDLIDIIAERNRRAGRGPIIRADVVRDAVRNHFEASTPPTATKEPAR